MESRTRTASLSSPPSPRGAKIAPFVIPDEPRRKPGGRSGTASAHPLTLPDAAQRRAGRRVAVSPLVGAHKPTARPNPSSGSALRSDRKRRLRKVVPSRPGSVLRFGRDDKGARTSWQRPPADNSPPTPANKSANPLIPLRNPDHPATDPRHRSCVPHTSPRPVAGKGARPCGLSRRERDEREGWLRLRGFVGQHWPSPRARCLPKKERASSSEPSRGER